MRVLDLFAGAGGLSLGLEAAGFESVAAVELDPDCCSTYASLFPRAELILATVQSVDFRGYAGKLDLVAGGPPCQPFSSGGKRLGADDDRNLIPEFVRAVREIKPPAFLMENVPGLEVGSRLSEFRAALAELNALGYEVRHVVLNAAEYGVPQKRRRLFVVGSQIGRFEFPRPSHGPRAGTPFEPAGSVLNVESFVGELNPAKVVYARNPDLRPSPYDGHLFNGGGRPIDLGSPCPTILASAGGNKTHFVDTLNDVPEYHRELLAGGRPRAGELPGGRRLTVAESALIQTFPRTVRFAGSRSSQYAQVGNAVPPLLAARLGFALKRLLFGSFDEAPAA